MLNLLKEANSFISKNKKSLIGKNVELDEGSGEYFKIINLIPEVINFEGDESGDVGVVIENEETHYIHPSALEDFLNGVDTGAFLKSNYKGGTIKLINKMENSTISISTFTSSPKELIGREIQYGEKTGKVTKVTNSGFVTFDNGDTYDWDDLLMIDALIIGLDEEEIIEEIIEEKPKLKYLVSWINKKEYPEAEDKIVDIDFFSEDNGFIAEDYINIEKLNLGQSTSTTDFDVEITAVDENFVLEKTEEKPEEKPTENKMDQFIFMYYVVKNKSKILSGHQYKEDATDEYSDRKEVGENLIEVMSRRDVEKLGLDLSDNTIWETDFHDWNIIEEAVNFGVTEGDYNEEFARNYIDSFKSNGKYSHVIKARLIYFLSHSQKHLKQAFLNSQIDKASTFIEKCTGAEMELMRMLKAE